MKEFHLTNMRRIAVVVLGLFFVWSAPSMAEGENSLPFTVINIIGQARHSTDGKNWHQLNRGDAFAPGSILQTADDGVLEICVASMSGMRNVIRPCGKSAIEPVIEAGMANPAMRLYPSSVLKIEKIKGNQLIGLGSSSKVTEGEIELQLQAGRILVSIPKPSSCVFKIKIPAAVTVVGERDFCTQASGFTLAITGSVNILNLPGGHDVTLAAGQSFAPYEPAGSTHIQAMKKELSFLRQAISRSISKSLSD